MKASTTWFDLTTLRTWKRPPVGIVRVEQRCAEWFLANNKDARFCYYEKASSAFFELSKTEVLEILNGQINTGSPPVTAIGPTRSQIVERNIKHQTKRALQKLPTQLRLPLETQLRARKELFSQSIGAVRKASKKMGELRERLRPRASVIAATPTDTRQPLRFAENDVYVSMGLDWETKDIPVLYQLKKEWGFKVIWFCYDIIPVKFPHLCVGEVADFFAHYFCDVSWLADHVLCISECSRRDFIELLNQLGSRVPEASVVRLGCEVTPVTEVLPPPGLECSPLLGQRYILFVSTIERRKNHEAIYRAYTRLIDMGQTHLPRVAFVGMQGWGVNDLMNDLRFDRRVSPYFTMLNHLSDADLAHLYRHAWLTVYPSLYEGWGLPVAESLSYGKLCIASNKASIPEIGGTLVDYCDPWDVNAWVASLKHYLDNPEDVLRREAEIRHNFQAFEWKETAQTIAKVALKLTGPAKLTPEYRGARF